MGRCSEKKKARRGRLLGFVLAAILAPGANGMASELSGEAFCPLATIEFLYHDLQKTFKDVALQYVPDSGFETLDLEANLQPNYFPLNSSVTVFTNQGERTSPKDPRQAWYLIVDPETKKVTLEDERGDSFGELVTPESYQQSRDQLRTQFDENLALVLTLVKPFALFEIDFAPNSSPYVFSLNANAEFYTVDGKKTSPQDLREGWDLVIDPETKKVTAQNVRGAEFGELITKEDFELRQQNEREALLQVLRQYIDINDLADSPKTATNVFALKPGVSLKTDKGIQITPVDQSTWTLSVYTNPNTVMVTDSFGDYAYRLLSPPEYAQLAQEEAGRQQALDQKRAGYRKVALSFIDPSAIDDQISESSYQPNEFHLKAGSAIQTDRGLQIVPNTRGGWHISVHPSEPTAILMESAHLTPMGRLVTAEEFVVVQKELTEKQKARDKKREAFRKVVLSFVDAASLDPRGDESPWEVFEFPLKPGSKIQTNRGLQIVPNTIGGWHISVHPTELTAILLESTHLTPMGRLVSDSEPEIKVQNTVSDESAEVSQNTHPVKAFLKKLLSIGKGS